MKPRKPPRIPGSPIFNQEAQKKPGSYDLVHCARIMLSLIASGARNGDSRKVVQSDAFLGVQAGSRFLGFRLGNLKSSDGDPGGSKTEVGS